MPNENSPTKPTVRTKKNQTVDVHELEIELNQGVYGPVRRVVLKSNLGPISYKPYRTTAEQGAVSGFNCKWPKREMLDLSELPPMLWELNNKLRTGICKLRIDYCVLTNGDEDDGRETLFMKKRQVDGMVFLNIEERVEDGN